MAGSLNVHILDDDLIARLKRRAARHGRSAEAEHREILAQALSREVDLGSEEPNLSGERPFPTLALPAPAPSPAMMKTTRFANVLLYRSFFTGERLNFLSRELERHRNIAKLIDERQAQLGAVQ